MRRNIPFRVTVQPNFYIHLVTLLFLFPLSWIASWMLAVVFHELCHYLCVKLFKGRIDYLQIGFGGFCIQCSVLEEWKNVISVLSGPVLGLLLVLVGKWFPKIAVCSLFLSLYNIIPLLPLDGGRALQILMQNGKAFWTMERIVLIILLLLALYAGICLRIGFVPILLVMVLWFNFRKIPCKEWVYKVQ